LGINRTQFNRYLCGESFPRPDVLSRICEFFEVDARILLEPIETLGARTDLISARYLSRFLGTAFDDIPADVFPDGFYRFSRQSFVLPQQYFTGVVMIKRDGGNLFLRGFDPVEAMRAQGLPHDRRAREYRGFVMRLEDGVSLVVSRVHGMTASFNHLNRISSFDNNFWVGYVARTVREHHEATRITRLVYEHLGRDVACALPAARQAGLCRISDLPLFHQRLLQPGTPFC
jgi:transcriptional regulator with XRE-family HTH domain